jgi:hypothetical protein
MVKVLAAIAVLLGGVTVSAFAPTRLVAAPRVHAIPSISSSVIIQRMSETDYDDSSPSDSSDDSSFTVQKSDTTTATIDVDNKQPTASETVVSSIMDYLPPSLSSDISASDRASINESILRLEALNPTKDPAYSPLINGVWTLKYAGGYSESKIPSPTRDLALFLYSGGYSPGLFALGLAQKLPSQLVELGDLEISISRVQPRIEAKIDVKLFGGSSESIEVRARLEEDSGLRFTETYESASVLGQMIDIPEALQYSRDLYVSYVDEDILVVRDGAGIPEILVRK